MQLKKYCWPTLRQYVNHSTEHKIFGTLYINFDQFYVWFPALMPVVIQGGRFDFMPILSLSINGFQT